MLLEVLIQDEVETQIDDETELGTEVLGNIREDGKTQVLLGWMVQWQRVLPEGVVIVRRRSCREA
jgi:hypothetical protein